MTLVLLSAPSDIDTAANKINAGIAGEFLNQLIEKYAPQDEEIKFDYVCSFKLRDRFDRILAVGEQARKALNIPQYLYTHSYQGIRTIAVYEHTVAVDLRKQKYDEAEEDDDGDEEGNVKEMSPTRVGNYAYWIEVGIEKLYKKAEPIVKINCHFKPSIRDIANYLADAQTVYLDIETRRNQEVFSPTVIDCIGILKDNASVALVIPIYRYDDKLHYTPKECCELVKLLSKPYKIVAHNAMFDLTVLAFFMGIRLPENVCDTMLMQQRIAPEAEKSLGHCIGAYTDMPYHKDEITVPHNSAQEEQLWRYNAKDLFGTREIHKKLSAIAEQDSGLKDSMDTANKAVTLFLEMSATGLLVKQDELNKAIADSAKEIARQFQIISVLAGRSINVGSTQQLAEYLHEDMGYKVIKISKKTGKPALGKKELQLLAVKTKNPIIPLIIKLKKLRKSSSMLKFTSL